MIRKRFGQLVGHVMKAPDYADAFTGYIDQIRAIQEATNPLSRAVHLEKEIIEAALEMASLQVELDERMKDPLFRESYEKFLNVVSEESASSSEQGKFTDRPIPVFERKTQHSDPKTEQAIREKLDQMKEGRADFLKIVVRELRGNTLLVQHFEEKLKKLGGEKYMASLDEAGLEKWKGLIRDGGSGRRLTSDEKQVRKRLSW